MKHAAWLTLLFFLALEPHWSVQQVGVELTITPTQATTDSKVAFECRYAEKKVVGAAYYTLWRIPSEKDKKETQAAVVEILCETGKILKQEFPGFPKPIPTFTASCDQVTISDVVAKRDVTSGQYRCDVQYIDAKYKQVKGNSQLVDLTVGDPTPPLSRFELANAAAPGAVIERNSQVIAGTNVSVTCQANPVDPPLEFTVKIGNQPAIVSAGGTESRVFFYSLVPRLPSVDYSCSAFNGFGELASDKFTVSVIYGPERSSVVIPKTADLQTTEELEICRVANNPPQPLRIVGLAKGILQTGYPRYVQKDGYSYAYVKLTEAAKEAKEARLTFTCGMDGLDPPVTGAVQLSDLDAAVTAPETGTTTTTTITTATNSSSAQVSTPSSAMMTIGIVIAVVLVFIIVVAVVAVALKRRSAANKAPNSNSQRYSKANQNDADAHHPTYETHLSGKPPIKVEDGRGEPV